ncbi:hypothetical protein [Leptospira perolatii]|nr:hypothetical protein [Leptospira perolatii]
MMKYALIVILSSYLFTCNLGSKEQCTSETKGQIVTTKPKLYKSREDQSPVVLDYLAGKYFYVCSGEYLGKRLQPEVLIKGFYIVEGTQQPSEEFYFPTGDLYFFNVRKDATLSEFDGLWTNRELSLEYYLTYIVNVKTKTISYTMNGNCRIDNSEVICFDEYSGKKSTMLANFVFANGSLKGRFNRLVNPEKREINLPASVKNLDFELFKCSDRAICNNHGLALIKGSK